jgi:hypothetical protein
MNRLVRRKLALLNLFKAKGDFSGARGSVTAARARVKGPKEVGFTSGAAAVRALTEQKGKKDINRPKPNTVMFRQMRPIRHST